MGRQRVSARANDADRAALDLRRHRRLRAHLSHRHRDLHCRFDRLRALAKSDRCSLRRAAFKASARRRSSRPRSRSRALPFRARMLGVAIGIQSLIVSVSTAAGPAIGGLILTFGSWPLLFWINVPFALVSLALSGRLPDMPRATHRFDWFSAVFSGAALALFITGLDQLRAPANTIFFGIEVAGAFILGTIVVRRQSALEVPFIAIDLLADPHHPALPDGVVHRVHRPERIADRAAVLLSLAGLCRRRDRLPDDAVSDRLGTRRDRRRTARRSLSCGHPRLDRPRHFRAGDGAARAHAGSSGHLGHRLAHHARRRGLRGCSSRRICARWSARRRATAAARSPD